MQSSATERAEQVMAASQAVGIYVSTADRWHRWRVRYNKAIDPISQI